MKGIELNGTYTVRELAHMLAERAGDYFSNGDPITSPKATVEYLKAVMSHYKSERFCVLFLDNRHRVISFDTLFRGTIDGASVHPREVVKASLYHNAAAVILVHNHPSGVSTPSEADIRLTSRLKESLALVDVRVLDHFIVGEDVVSFSEKGLI